MGIMLYMCSVYFANSYGSASVDRHFSLSSSEMAVLCTELVDLKFCFITHFCLPVTNRKGDTGIAF